MFDTSDPQQRERLLVVVGAVVLIAIVAVVLPAQFTEVKILQNERDKLTKEIEELEHLAYNKDEIQHRLSIVATQGLAPPGVSSGDAVSAYNSWLRNLVIESGLDYAGGGPPTRAGTATVRVGTVSREAYARWTFTVTTEGTLAHIADFLRRFHSAEYLHLIQTVSPRPIQNSPGMFSVQFRIEALALPGTRVVNVPEVAEISDEEHRMLSTIMDRAILSHYMPSEPQAEDALPPRPTARFFNAPYCYVVGITESDGKPQCWIGIRPTDERYYFFEEEWFMLDNIRCTIKKIEVGFQRVQIAADGEVYAVRLGHNFDQAADEACYFVSLVDADGTPWMEESMGEPLCQIEYNPLSPTDVEKYTLKCAENETFPMKYVTGTVRRIDLAANQVQIEAAGILYTLKNGGSFAEFADE